MEMSDKLHSLFNEITTIYDGSNIDQIKYDKGIYIFFDNNEKYNGLKRIIRVGTHGTKKDNSLLKTRLDAHYHGNRNSSIFRKNIGRAIIKKNNYDEELYLFWNQKNNNNFDDSTLKKIGEIETKVTEYMKNQAMKFIIIPFDTVKDRKRFETGIISALCKCNNFQPSNGKWLGNFVPDKGRTKIHKNRLWCSDCANGEPLTDVEYEKLKEILILKK